MAAAAKKSPVKAWAADSKPMPPTGGRTADAYFDQVLNSWTVKTFEGGQTSKTTFDTEAEAKRYADAIEAKNKARWDAYKARLAEWKKANPGK